MKIPRRARPLIDAYVSAKETVVEAGFADEIDWHDGVQFHELEESDFLREAAWVVLSAGMSEKVIRRKFPAITSAFLHWKSAGTIVSQRGRCRRDALREFGSSRKINAILQICDCVATNTYRGVASRIRDDGVDFITTLPYMGPATSLHLAKNIGLPVAKPDRHLLRAASCTGFSSPASLCEHIADVVGDSIAIVDLVIWRYSTLVKSSERFGVSLEA